MIKSVTTQGTKQTIAIGAHELPADMDDAGGPSPHDYFDAALASCKSLTAHWYAKRHDIPLERVETEVTRDNSEERKGVYRLAVKVTFHGAMSEDQRAALYKAIGACPIHKLMTTSDVIIS